MSSSRSPGRVPESDRGPAVRLQRRSLTAQRLLCDDGRDADPCPASSSRSSGAVLTLRLESPDQRNAIDDVMMSRSDRRLDLAGRDESVRAIYLTGAGEHFCGGADIIARNAAPDAGRGSGRSNAGFPRWPIGSSLSSAKSRSPSSVR